MVESPTDAKPPQLDWPWLNANGTTPGAHVGEGLRERKKRLMRQLLSDTATGMFLERGFDEVRVAEVAEACGVSEKTVFNYFPNKESLLLDREESTAEAVRRAASAAGTSLVEAMLSALEQDLRAITEALTKQGDDAAAMAGVRRFIDLIENTPSLRAHQRESMDRLVAIAADALAQRLGLSPTDPEPQVAAHALVGLWRIYYRALERYADGQHTPHRAATLIRQEIRRAAHLTNAGLSSFGDLVQGGDYGGDRARNRVAAAVGHRDPFRRRRRT